MKFGKTKDQVQQERLEYIMKMLKDGEVRFAWKPVTLVDGRKVWLEKYKAYWEIKKGFQSTEAVIKEYMLEGNLGLYSYMGKIVEHYGPIN